MKVFEDIIYQQDAHAIIGFINTQHELEYTIYTAYDGGNFPLEDKEYDKEEFRDLLELEFKDFIARNKSTITIIGHEIRIVSDDAKFIKASDLDEEIYEINQSILDGNDSGNIFVKSKNTVCSWEIKIRYP